MSVDATRPTQQFPSSQESQRISPQVKYAWGFAGKGLQITRYYLNGLARNTLFIDMVPANTPNHLKSIAANLKLLSIVGIPYKLSDIHALAGSLLKSHLIKDYEGIKLGILTMALILSDLMESVQSYVNGVLAITLTKPYAILPSISTPLGLTMSTTGSILRIMKIKRAYNLHQSLQVQKENQADQIAYLNKCLGIDEVEAEIQNASTEDLKLLLSKKEAIINRAIPKEARDSFNHIMSLLKQAPNVSLRNEEILTSINHIQFHLKEKGQVDVIGLLSNMLIIAAVICFKVGIATSLPYFLFALAFTVRLGIHIYEDYSSEFLAFHNSLKEPLSL